MVKQLCIELTRYLVSHPIYRSFQLFEVISCVIALIAHPVVYYKFLSSSALHNNLKRLIGLLFIVNMIYAISVLTTLIYQAVLWLTHRNPCDLIPKRTFYIYYKIIELYTLLCMLVLQVLMNVERTIATAYVNSYESWKKSSGLIYIFAAV
ncbi:hypothetical protein COOONC_11181 [Cooperia oncophora]